MLKNLNSTLRNFPQDYWILIGAAFIDQLGKAILYPFFALYATVKFNVGMTEVGIMFAIFALTNMLGSFISGELTDSRGRKFVLILSLVASALSSLLMGMVNELSIFYIGAGLVGLFGSAGEPAQQAMIADLLPEEKLTQGYSISRVATNLSLALGPMLGGLIALNSFTLLFIGDAVFSSITAIIVLRYLPETKPQITADETEVETIESPIETGRVIRDYKYIHRSSSGYGRVGRDYRFMMYIFISMMLIIADVQLDSSLPVYLRDVHSISPQQYGYILGLNAGIVVLFQLSITKRTSAFPPFLTIAIGAIFYAIGFSMYGYVFGYPLFLLAIVIITLGEMIVSPVAQSLVMRFAPKDMRGRYTAVYGMSWLVPYTFGPYLAGIIMDNYNPAWVWYIVGLFSLTASTGFGWLYLITKGRFPKNAAA